MLFIKDYICYPSDSLCEDAVGFSENFIFVLDGASCLTGQNIINESSDAYWFVNELKAGLQQRLENEDNRTTSEILYEVLFELNKTYYDELSKKNIKLPKDSPSAGIALFREQNGYLEFFGLGDCIGVITTVHNKTKVLYDKSLSQFDTAAINSIIEIRKNKGLSFLEAKNISMDILIKNRNLRNMPNGYWILEPKGLGIPHAITFQVPINEVKAISVFSDGFAQLVDCFGKYQSYSQLHYEMQKDTLENLYNMLYDLQESDPYCNNYPRFKVRDDTSAVLAVIRNDC